MDYDDYLLLNKGLLVGFRFERIIQGSFVKLSPKTSVVISPRMCGIGNNVLRGV